MPASLLYEKSTRVNRSTKHRTTHFFAETNHTSSGFERLNEVPAQFVEACVRPSLELEQTARERIVYLVNALIDSHEDLLLFREQSRRFAMFADVRFEREDHVFSSERTTELRF